MRIICPACGLSSLVSDDNRKGAVKCARCGKRINWSAEPRDGGGIEEDDLARAAASAGSTRAAGKPVRQKKSDMNRMIFAGSIGAILTGVLVVLVVVAKKAVTPTPIATAAPATRPVEAWDRAHRGELLAMKDRAESLAIAGKWRESYDAYRAIIVAVADHDLSDPVVVQLVTGARLGEDRVLGMIMTGAKEDGTNAAASASGAMAGGTPATTQATGAPIANGEGARGLRATTQATAAPIVTSTPTSGPSVASAATQPSGRPVVLDAAEIAADTAPPLAGAAPVPPNLHAYTLPDAVTDEQIGEAITKGVNFLKGQFIGGEITTRVPGKAAPQNKNAPQPRSRVPQSNLDQPPSDLGGGPQGLQPIQPGPMFLAPWASSFNQAGVDALCVYALLHAGQAMDQKILGEQDPFVDRILTVLKEYNMVFTYHRSLRAAALAVFNRVQDTGALEEDVRWLLAASQDGAYTYTIPAAFNKGAWDNSNSQYGLLGVWSGAMAGKAVPQDYWRSVEHHWNQCANRDGTFGYSLGTSSTTMTCAGVASLLVAHDYMDSPDMVGQAGNQFSPNPAIDNGLKWLDDGDNCMSAWDNMGGAGYALYGLERVGLASGFKYFGVHDWYGELAKRLVGEQHFDGSWGVGAAVNGNVAPQTLVDTAYSLLFLARGRHPILYNKLRYDGDWNNRPHDVSHLTRFAANQLERPLNWQVVNLRRNWFDWMDSPVLYIAGDKKPDFSQKDYEALRGFAEGGGLIFTHADGGSPAFTRWVVDMARKIWPQYEMLQVPREHPIYSTVYPLKNPPPLLSIGNGSRLLLVHSPTDLAGGWQLNWPEEKKMAFQLGVNLFIYAAGKGSLNNRLATSYIPEDPDRPESNRQIARLQYAAEWDPEPYAWGRFRRYFQWETHQGIEPVTVQLKDLKPGSVPMAVLTGTVRHDFTEAEQLAARAYVQAGGVLVIDACGGQADFVKCVERTLLPQAFEGVSPLPIGPNHPLLLASRPHADDLTHLLLRGYANENGGKQLPILTIAYGKGWVIFSRLDITTGLLGTQSWGTLGYDPAYAQALMKNAVLWAEARSPQPVAAATNP